VYHLTVCAHKQTTWFAIAVTIIVMRKDFMNAVIIEDKSQTPILALRLEESALTVGDEVEE
jgi:hypothetical protein